MGGGGGGGGGWSITGGFAGNDSNSSSSVVVWLARVNIVSTVALGIILTVGVLNRKVKPVMLHMRGTRFSIMGINMLILGLVETAKIGDVRLNLFIQILGKIFVPWYFVKCVAVDATKKGPLPLWRGVWEGHEYWHCFILLLHLAQLYALTTHHGTWQR